MLFMEAPKLCNQIGLNKMKVSKVAFKHQICYHENRNPELLNAVFRQIAINLHVIYRSFDKMQITELESLLRKNGVKGFVRHLKPELTNPDKRIEYVEKNMRPQAKSKLLYIHNHLLRYVNSATA